MARGAGSISLLIDSPLRDLALAMRAVPTDVKKEIGSQTKKAGKPIWFEETRGRAATRIQQRVLVNSADVSVTARNITFKAGGKGRLSSGTEVPRLARSAEFGMNPGKQIASKSKKGKAYTRSAGNAFGPNRRAGNVAYPAAREAIPRVASLWVQTARRSIHEAIEEVS
ncbi:hypothetical protein CVS54_01368 [Microbacterium oxydans]|uniref:HK97 gp10 family phage protein n=1 Tax=Microbacterium oxydans TaxID=82380 RepID=A0A3S9WIY7_9MICO|nr:MULTISPECIES: hypothetical protein [Microbacterium]AZS40046.1 hypothetical protein CVS54_01368 [Microbacterium oxydans]